MFDIPIRHFWKKNGDPHTRPFLQKHQSNSSIRFSPSSQMTFKSPTSPQLDLMGDDEYCHEQVVPVIFL